MILIIKQVKVRFKNIYNHITLTAWFNISSLAIMFGLLPLCPSTTTPNISGNGVEFSLAGQNRPSCKLNIFNPSLRSFSSNVDVREGSENGKK